MSNIIRITLLAVGASVMYGMVHDQVTARVSLEYFTVGHLDLFPTRDPTFLGLAWGILATWWVGLLLGVPLALIAHLGPLPRLTPRELVRPILLVMGVTAVTALLAGTAGFVLACLGAITLSGTTAARVPAPQHAAFLAAFWAHSASYAVGVVGSIALWSWAWRARRKTSGASLSLHSAARTAPDWWGVVSGLTTGIGGLSLVLVALGVAVLTATVNIPP